MAYRLMTKINETYLTYRLKNLIFCGIIIVLIWHRGESKVRMSYKRLWKLLIDRNLKKKDLMESADTHWLA